MKKQKTLKKEKIVEVLKEHSAKLGELNLNRVRKVESKWTKQPVIKTSYGRANDIAEEKPFWRVSEKGNLTKVNEKTPIEQEVLDEIKKFRKEGYMGGLLLIVGVILMFCSKHLVGEILGMSLLIFWVFSSRDYKK